MMTRITMTTRNQGRQRHQPETNSPRSPFSLLVQRTKSSLPRMHVQSISLDSRQSTNITRQSTAFPLLGLSYKVAPHPATKPTASRSSQWLKPETVSARSGAVHLWTKRRYNKRIPEDQTLWSRRHFTTACEILSVSVETRLGPRGRGPGRLRPKMPWPGASFVLRR